MQRRFVFVSLAGLILSILVGFQPNSAFSQAGIVPACGFSPGFKGLHDMIPDVVGPCIENERIDPSGANSSQRTNNGLLVWRKSGSWTAFTNGPRSWVLGPFGLQQRASTERFDWEDVLVSGQPSAGSPPQAPPVPIPPAPIAAPPSPQPFLQALPSPTFTPLPVAPCTCAQQVVNDHSSRALPLVNFVDGVITAAQWAPSGVEPERVTHRYYRYFHPADGTNATVGVGAGDDGGWKLRVHIYAPDATLVGMFQVGANERQELTWRPYQPGEYMIQIWNYRPADVPFRVDARKS